MDHENERAHLYASGRVKFGGFFSYFVSFAFQLDRKFSLLDAESDKISQYNVPLEQQH